MFESTDNDILRKLQFGYLTADFILPLSYGPFFSSLLYLALKKQSVDDRMPDTLKKLYPYVSLSMAVMALLDLGENYCIYNLVDQYLKYDTIHSGLCVIGSKVTMIKFMFPLLALFPYFMFLLFQLIFKKHNPKKET